MINPFKDYCFPAILFLVLAIPDIVFIVLFKLKAKKEMSRQLIFVFLLFSCALGWSFIINYTCQYDQTAAYIVGVIPFLHLTFGASK
jgi:hypothetical protein